MSLPSTHLGILGGGQLARMLCDAARKMGLSVRVFAQSTHDSAVLTHPDFDVGRLDSPEALRSFLHKVQSCVFENEFVDDRLLAKEGGNVRFLPPLSVLALVRDKVRQKRLLETAKVPALPYEVRPMDLSAPGWIERVSRRFAGGDVVFKWSQQGYDGKGVFFGCENAAAFVEGARQAGFDCYAEPRLAFRRELAIVACRSVNGEFAAYPLVLSEQRSGVCLWVQGPAVAFGVPSSLEAQAIEAARRVGETAGLVGTFALEFFETADGDLLVNEIAPRVHNSGHYSLDASVCSQFENHWRAVLGLGLGPTSSKGVFAMRNLLGPENVKKAKVAPPDVEAGIELHWYGKSESRPGRKLGHLNAVAPDPKALKSLVDKMQSRALAWEEECAK